MKSRKLLLSAAVLPLVLAAPPSFAAPASENSGAAASAPLKLPDIAFTRIVLKNGLTLIVHEDHKAPIVAVNLWYHVGSKDEPAGRTGFAHLFEHLMFGSTGGNQRGWFERLEAAGATDINGTTAQDRTNFFETVPTASLDMTLAMEAGRMGRLLDNFSEALLTTQRGVVQNEKRQDENQPYAVADEIITKSVWPAGHPYSHTVIGEMTDLDAAKVSDVRDWFARYYGPTNATLVLAGDITVAEAEAKAEKYFGSIPPGPPLAHQKEWIAKRTGSQRAVVQDHVPQARLYIEWNAPGYGSDDAAALDLLCDVLSAGKDSRLYRRLIYNDKIATDVSASIAPGEIASLFDVELTAKPGTPLGELERAFRQELETLLRDGPTEAELERYKTRAVANFIRSAERVGGFGGKSDILAENQTYLGDPGAWRKRLEFIEAATPSDLAAAGRRWLSDGSFTLEVTPFPSFAPAGATGAAEAIPDAGRPAPPHFPKVRTAVLANGLKIVVAERHETPTVSVSLVVPAGSTTDPSGMNGLSAVDAAAMADGTSQADALQFDDLKTALGVSLETSAALDVSVVNMNALSARLEPSLDLLADVVLRPAMRPSDIAREKALKIAELEQIKDDPINAALRLASPLTYGFGHPYGALTTKADLSAVSPEAVKRHHALWYQPKGATLVVAGDTTLEAILPLLKSRFGAWGATGAVAPAVPPKPAIAPSPGTVYFLDKPGALQSVIVAAVVAPPRDAPDDIPIQAMITTLGGAFTSRLNLNLREDKHWSYGAFAFDQVARGPSLAVALTGVQSDKTKESFIEVRRELTDLTTTRPLTPHELELAKNTLTLSLPGRWETAQAVDQSLVEVATYGLAQDYFATYARHVDDLSLADVRRAADEVVRPNALTWIVVGDKTSVLGPLKTLGLKIVLIDADGHPIAE